MTETNILNDMMDPEYTLPETNGLLPDCELEKMSRKQLIEYAVRLNTLYINLHQYAVQLRKSVFGSKGEQKITKPVKTKEAEATETQSAEPAVKKERHKPKRQKGCIARKKEGLPAVDVYHALSEEEIKDLKKQYDVTEVKEIGEYVYEEVCTIPETWYVKRHHVSKYVVGKTVVNAELVDKIRPHSDASPSMIASILNTKFSLYVPWARIEKNLLDHQYRITRQEMMSLAKYVSENIFKPVTSYYKYLIIIGGFLQADESFIGVQYTDRPDLIKKSKSYIWCIRNSVLADGPALVCYRFDPTRSANVLYEELKDFEGVILCDAYPGYDSFAKGSEGRITLQRCWIHMRRYFVNVLESIPGYDRMPEEKLKTSLAWQAVDKISEIMYAESQLKETTAEERLEGRQKTVKPLVDEYFQWLKEIADDEDSLPAGSGLERAVNYALHNEKELKTFLNEPNIACQNNGTEILMTPIAMTRNNAKMFSSMGGAESAAVILSIVQTAKNNGVHPMTYMQYLLETVPALLQEHRDDENNDYMAAVLPNSEQFKAYQENYGKRIAEEYTALAESYLKDNGFEVTLSD